VQKQRQVFTHWSAKQIVSHYWMSQWTGWVGMLKQTEQCFENAMGFWC